MRVAAKSAEASLSDKSRLLSVNQTQCIDTIRRCSRFIPPCLQELNTVTSLDKKEGIARKVNILHQSSALSLEIVDLLNKTCIQPCMFSLSFYIFDLSSTSDHLLLYNRISVW